MYRFGMFSDLVGVKILGKDPQEDFGRSFAELAEAEDEVGKFLMYNVACANQLTEEGNLGRSQRLLRLASVLDDFNHQILLILRQDRQAARVWSQVLENDDLLRERIRYQLQVYYEIGHSTVQDLLKMLNVWDASIRHYLLLAHNVDYDSDEREKVFSQYGGLLWNKVSAIFFEEAEKLFPELIGEVRSLAVTPRVYKGEIK